MHYDTPLKNLRTSLKFSKWEIQVLLSTYWVSFWTIQPNRPLKIERISVDETVIKTYLSSNLYGTGKPTYFAFQNECLDWQSLYQLSIPTFMLENITKE